MRTAWHIDDDQEMNQAISLDELEDAIHTAFVKRGGLRLKTN